MSWRYWWTMPVLLFAGIIGPGVDLACIAELPPAAAIAVSVATIGSWMVLAIAAVLTALWGIDALMERVMTA